MTDAASDISLGDLEDQSALDEAAIAEAGTPQMPFAAHSAAAEKVFIDRFRRDGVVVVSRLVSPALLNLLNKSVDRLGSRARRYSKVLSGGVIQLAMDMFGTKELTYVSRLAAELVESQVIKQAAAALWGEGDSGTSPPLYASSRLVLEGGSEQIPHADALYPNAIVVLLSMRSGQARSG